MIKELSDRLDSMPEPEEWLDEKTEALKAGKDAFMNSNAVELLWQETQKTIDNCMKLLKESAEMTLKAGLTRGSMFAAGDLSKVAEVIRNLARVDRVKKLSTGEKKLLNNARMILSSEMSMVLGIDEEAALARIEKAV